MKNRRFQAKLWLIVSMGACNIVFSAISSWAQDRTPRTGWGDQETVESATTDIAPDLQSLFDRSTRANSVIEFNSVVEGCRTIAKDTTRSAAERDYAKKLLSWGANRRGEIRTDMAAQMVRDGHIEEATKLDLSAAEDFALSIKYDDSRWRAHHNLGVVLALAGEVDAAIRAFGKTIERQPNFAEAYFNRAELRAQQEDWTSALVDYDKAIELSPDDAGMHTARAKARTYAKNLDGALADYETAMRLQPESGEAATDYADMCQSMARWKEAASAYQKAMQLTPNDPRALQNAAWMMATCPDEYFRNPETALKTAMRAIEASEGEVNAHRLHVLSVAQAANGDFDSAVASINEAMQITTDPVLRKDLAQHRALFQRKKPFVQP
jgi:tetratricopeptide (TPR) repeat protein